MNSKAKVLLDGKKLQLTSKGVEVKDNFKTLDEAFRRLSNGKKFKSLNEAFKHTTEQLKGYGN